MTFPLLALAFKALDDGMTRPAVLNAANEIAVNAFLREEISFKHIPEVVFDTYEKTPEMSELSTPTCMPSSWQALISAMVKSRWAKGSPPDMVTPPCFP